MNYIDERSFTKKKNANQITKKIIKFFAAHFTKGDEKKALKLIDSHNVELRK